MITKTKIQTLLENVQMQRDLEIYADAILKHAIQNRTEAIIGYLSNAKSKFPDKDLSEYIDTTVLLCPPFKATGLINVKKLKLSKSFLDLFNSKNMTFGEDKWDIKNNPLYLIFEIANEGFTRGQYIPQKYKDHIKILLWIDDVEVAFEKIKDYYEYPLINTSTVGEVVRKLYYESKDILIHELQHAIDNRRSQGKHIDKKHKDAMTKFSSGEFGDYYKLSHEISARFSQVVSSLNKNWDSGTRERVGTFGGFETFELNWRNYLGVFKELFSGWKLMHPEIQKRLINRLYVHYKEKIGSIPVDLDITNNVNKLEKDLSQHCEIQLQYSHQRGLIWINEFICKNDADAIKVMKAVVRFAETYRKIIEINPSEYVVGSNKKELVPFLLQFGFVKNKGRNRDFRYDSAMIRYPKRKETRQEIKK